MKATATETVIGVRTPAGTVLIASPGFTSDDFAKVVDTLHQGTDVDLNLVEHLETDNGGAIWYVPLAAIAELTIDLREGEEELNV